MPADRKAAATWSCHAYGLELVSGFPLPGMRPIVSSEPDVSLSMVRAPRAARQWSGPAQPPARIAVISHGRVSSLELGQAGDHRFDYQEEGAFHLSPAGDRLLCAPRMPEDRRWQRELLDTVLFATSVIREHEVLHASAVLYPDGVVAFVSVEGGGKTSLAAELVRRGRPLVCDDVLALGAVDGEVLAYPGPPLMSLPLDTAAVTPRLGTTVATFAEESEDWVAVENATHEGRPLACLYTLERREGLQLGVSRMDATVLDLLPYRRLPGYPPEREAARFELLSDVASAIPMYRIQAGTDSGPATIADLVDAARSRVARVPAAKGPEGRQPASIA